MSTLKFRHSATAGNAPASLLAGELAINEADRILYYPDPSGAVAKFRPETLLAHGSITATASLTLQLSASFPMFRLRLNRLTTSKTSSDNLQLRVSVNAGSTFDTTNAHYSWVYDYIEASATNYSYTTSSTGALGNHVDMGYISPESLQDYGAYEGYISLEKFGSTFYAIGGGFLWTFDPTAGVVMSRSAWYYSIGNASQINAISLYPATGPNMNCDYSLFGITMP